MDKVCSYPTSAFLSQPRKVWVNGSVRMLIFTPSGCLCRLSVVAVAVITHLANANENTTLFSHSFLLSQSWGTGLKPACWLGWFFLEVAEKTSVCALSSPASKGACSPLLVAPSSSL